MTKPLTSNTLSASRQGEISNTNQTERMTMTTEQREQLREVLIDYIQLLTSDTERYPEYPAVKVAQVRLLLREVA